MKEILSTFFVVLVFAGVIRILSSIDDHSEPGPGIRADLFAERAARDYLKVIRPEAVVRAVHQGAAKLTFERIVTVLLEDGKHVELRCAPRENAILFGLGPFACEED